MTMHVVWVNPAATTPEEAGGTRHFDFATIAKELGIRITVIASDRHYMTGRLRHGNTRPYLEQVAPGGWFLWLPAGASKRATTGARASRDLRFAAQVMRGRWASELVHPPNWIIGSSPTLLSAYAASSAARRLGLPFCVEIRDVWPDSLIDLGILRPRSPQAGVARWIERRVYARAKLGVTLPPEAGPYLEQFALGALHIPNGRVIGQADMGVGPEPLRRPGPFVVTYAGAHGRANGLDTVLDAADHLRDELEAGRLVIRLIGDGPMRPALMDRVRMENLRGVELHHSMPKREVLGALQASDALLLHLEPSPVFRWGVSPNKLFDYMQARRPIIWAVGAANNPVEEASCGVSCQPGAPEQLAQAVRQLMAIPLPERCTMGARGYKYLNEFHDHKKNLDRLVRWLRSESLPPMGAVDGRGMQDER